MKRIEFCASSGSLRHSLLLILPTCLWLPGVDCGPLRGAEQHRCVAWLAVWRLLGAAPLPGPLGFMKGVSGLHLAASTD